MNWYNKVIFAQGVQSLVQEGMGRGKGKFFFVVFGNTFDIKGQLGRQGLGFSYFQGRWSMPVDKAQAIRPQIEALGIDTSPLDQDLTPAAEVPAAPAETAAPQTPADQQLSAMKAGVEQAIKSAPGKDKAKEILQYINDTIDKLGSMVDEAAASDLVKGFLAFSAKFWKYSFGNQMLIWFQKSDATHVAGAKQWFEKFGRQVTNYDASIHIIAPMASFTREGWDLKKKMSPEEWDKVKSKYAKPSYKGVIVYDVSDTAPIEGWKGTEGQAPFEPAEWRQENNENTEEIEALLNAARDWGKAQGIDIGEEKMGFEQGGYSAGKKIRVNDAYQGINLFSTLVHELAHEVLHQVAEAQTMPKMPKEIDAESTAYIVLKHFGFDATDSPNYLALWKARGEDIKGRRENIHKAVKAIIEGVTDNISKAPLPES